MRPILVLLVLAACTGAEASPSVTPAPGVTAHLDITQGADQVGQVHQPLPAPVTVKTTDKDAVAVPQQLVNFVVTKGGGSVFVGAVLTNEQGEAQNQWTLGDTAEIQELEARAIDDQGQSIVLAKIHATAEPGPLAVAHFALHQVQVADGESVTLTTTGADAYGNILPGPVPAALDTLGSLVGDRWTANGFGRARFEIPGDTMTVYARPNLASLSGEYHQPVMGTAYVESAMMSWDSLSARDPTAHDCSQATTQTGPNWASWGGVDFLATRADNPDSVQFSYPYLYYAICVDLRAADPVWWTYYFYPNDLDGPVLTYRWQLQLLEASPDSLVLTSGGALADTLVIHR
jgi:hypothetical protein